MRACGPFHDGIGGVVELAGVAVVRPDAALWASALEAFRDGLAMAVGLYVDPAALPPGRDVFELAPSAIVGVEVAGRGLHGRSHGAGRGDWRIVADWWFAPFPDDRDGATVVLGWPERGLPVTRFPLPAGALSAAAARAHTVRGPA